MQNLPETDPEPVMAEPEEGTLKTIYILRSQCERCDLDKMEVFYNLPNATPAKMYRKLRAAIRKKFPRRYGCRHKIKFTEETEERYRWDTVKNQAVEVEANDPA